MDMKRITGFTLLLLGGACTQAPNAPKAEVTEARTPAASTSTTSQYRIDVNGSQLRAIGTKVTGRHEIAFPIKEGLLQVDGSGCVTGGKVVIHIAGLQVLDLTGELKEKLEKHLKSPDFFDAEKYPEGVFEITSCEKTDTAYVLSGNLTLRGVTKGIRFPAKIAQETAALVATTSFNINRQEWGIAYKGKVGDLIRDEVNIFFTVRAM